MSEPQILMSGLAFPESPRWHDGRLWLAGWGGPETTVEEAATGQVLTVAAPAAGVGWP